MSAYSRIDLRQFHIGHPEACIVQSDDDEQLVGLWGAADLRFDLTGLGDNALDVLNAIKVDSRFDAIFHLESNHLEFAYTYLDPNNAEDTPVIDRRFTISFQDAEYPCWFATPSDRLLTLARSVRRLPTDRGDRVMAQLGMFRDGQRIDELPPAVQRYFTGKVPRNFYVDISSCPNVDVASLVRHLNLLIHYYDRRSPLIVVRTPASASEDRPMPTRFLAGDVPERLNAREVDDVVMMLLEVALTNAPRAAFLYLYQVFEYAGHYYIDDKARRALKRMLRDPALANCDDRKVAELFSVLSDLHHHDDQRMQKVVEDHCDARHLWPDIENDIDFFSAPIEFDGGLRIERIVSKDATEDTWCDSFKSLFQVLTRIRNCIVHAREKRESKVILPTPANNDKLARFKPIIRRMAEDVAFRA